jgi:hypothetical protein
VPGGHLSAPPIVPNLPDPRLDPIERAAERAYCAFLESARNFLPPYVQSWSQLHPRVRGAWMDAISAIY